MINYSSHVKDVSNTINYSSNAKDWDDINIVTLEDVTDVDDKPNQSGNVQVHTVLAEVHAIEYHPDQLDVDETVITCDDQPEQIYTLL